MKIRAKTMQNVNQIIPTIVMSASVPKARMENIVRKSLLIRARVVHARTAALATWKPTTNLLVRVPTLQLVNTVKLS